MFAALALATSLVAVAPSGLDGFAARVQQAKMAEAAASGPAYQKALWDKIGNLTTDAYKACLVSHRNDKTPFTLVFNVDAQGKPQHLVVQPTTPVARCMADQFATWSYPSPPATPKPYPLEIDFSVDSGQPGASGATP